MTIEKRASITGAMVMKCNGEGQGSCKGCADAGIWNVEWMCFLYKIPGMEGCYCENCVKEILRGDGSGKEIPKSE